MRQWIALAAAIALAGCSTSTYEADKAPASWPTVTIDDNRSTIPNKLYVYVTNNGDQSYYTGYSDFRVHDADGVVYENDLTASYWSGDGFPSFIEIFPGETVKGYLVFKVDDDNPPYDLTYKHHWGRSVLHLNATATLG